MKIFALFAAMTSAYAAFASFEVVLVSDSGTNTVHRYDPISGSYFGSFGAGILSNPVGVTADGNTGNSYVYDANGRLSVWKYSTGAYVNSYAVGAGGTALTQNSDGTLNVAFSDRVIRYSTGGTTLATYVRKSTNRLWQGILHSDGLFYLSNSDIGGSYALEWFNYSTGAFVNSTTNWVSKRTMPISPVGGFNAVNIWESTTSIVYEKDTLNSGPSNYSPISDATLTGASGVATGHGGMTYVTGQIRATPTIGGIMRWDRNTMTLGSVFGNGQLKTPTGIASVIAPEPTTMAVFAIGAVALLRRRRK